MKTDLCCIRSKHVHTPVSLRKPLRCGFTVLLCSCLLLGASHCRAQEAQDAAAAARQERARKEQSKQPKHVYTEEDLGHAKILTPEDEARFTAQRQPLPPGEPQPSLDPSTFDASAVVPQLPLGDIARRYRSAKLALQASSPFHLPFDEPAFAALAAPIVPVSKPAPPRPTFSPAHPKLAPTHPSTAVAPAIANSAPLRRVDPFARRSVVAPPTVAQIAPTAPVAQPHVSRSVPTPELRQPKVSPSIAAPNIGFRKFAPGAAEPNVVPRPIVPVSPASQPRIDS